MLKHDVEITPINLNIGKELSNNFYINCLFCEKFIEITPDNFNSHLKLGNNEYCAFCLRNRFYHNKNILIFSFRAIVGHYYYNLYKKDMLWLSEIESYLNKHEVIGLQNPILSYDPHTFLWFADFNLIGSDQVLFEEIKQTIKNMYDVFELNDMFSPSFNVWDKFDKAIDIFYEDRKRPEDRRMLIPTVDGEEKLRDFNRKLMTLD